MDIDEFLDREVPLIEKEPIVTKELVEYKEILEKINSCIKRNELEQAEKLYSKLWFKIKEEKFTWRQDLYDALIEINKKLEESLNKLHQEITAKISAIHTLIAKTKSSLKEGKKESALTAYSEIIAIYNEIPHLFLKEKKTIYLNEILPLHKELREKIEKTFFDSFHSKQSQINNLIYLTKIELQKNNIKETVKFYTECLNLYNALPDGFFLQKIELSNKILELYKEVSIILEISNLKSRLKLKSEEKVSEKSLHVEKISSESTQPKRSILPEIPIPTKKLEKTSPVKKLKKTIKKLGKKPKAVKKPKKILPIEKLKKLKSKKAEKPSRIEKLKKPPIKKLKIPVPTKKLEKIKKLKPIKKPEKPHPVEKPKPLEIAKKASLKEELVKRKLDRALFKLNKGNIKGANEDLQDALRLEPDNEEAKRLLREVSKKLPLIEKTPKRPIPPEKPKLIKKPEKPKPPKPKPLEIAKKASLKEELVKRKLDRALFKLNKGNIKGANEDLQDALRLDPNNEEAKRLLEKIK